MNIGIVGSGRIGATVGKLWHAAGHAVKFSSRHPQTLDALAAELGARASVGTVAEAAAFGEVVLLSVPLVAVPALAAEIGGALRGKLVLDTCNAYGERDGAAATAALEHPAGSAGWVAAQLPGARVVKAFNSVYFKLLESHAHRGAESPGIPLAGDDAAALATAAQLVSDAGFTPVVVGGLAEGKRFQPGTEVYNTGLPAAEVARKLGVH